MHTLLQGSLSYFVCALFQINLTGFVLKGSSVRKFLVREAKSRAAVTLIVGISKPHTIG